MKKQVKLYLHDTQYQPIAYQKRTGLFGLIKKITFGILNTLMITCYAVGMAVLYLVRSPLELVRAVATTPARARIVIHKLSMPKFRRLVAVFTLLTILAGSSIYGLNLIAAGQTIKGQVLGTSTSGLGFLQDAQTALESQNTAAAQANLGKALEQFKNSRATLDSAGITLNSLLSVVPQKRDADKLLLAAQEITEASIKATQLLKLTQNLKLSAIGLSNGSDNGEQLEQIQTLLNDCAKLAGLSAQLISEVSISSLPENYQPAFLAAQDAAKLFLQNAQSLNEVSSLLFDLLLGSKNILLVFQNNNELRASGGFMGTIGNARLSNGSIGSLDVRSVYDWDGQLKEKILPPQPLYAVNNRWFLRDSNWFASFPMSANRLSALYEKEGGETPDLIITLTPEVILDMLERTGNIELPQHGVTLTKDNFVEKTQEETSINYDKQVNQPKQFLADFFPLLMERLGSTEGDNGGVMAFLEIFQQNLYKKQILLYSRDNQIEKKILAFNWGGEIKDTDRDYLSIVNSNLGGTKTDRTLQRSINLQSTVADDGSITNNLTYTVKNPLPDNPALTNKSFVRIYVPAGATLISSAGFNTEIQLPRLETEGYTLDDKVQEWQHNLSQDINTGTYTGKESGKTWFGNWLEVAGGETKTVTISYKLPYKLGNIDRQSLLVQKQPGSQTQTFSYDLNFAGRSSLWKSDSATLNDNHLKYEQDLLADTFIGLVLSKP